MKIEITDSGISIRTQDVQVIDGREYKGPAHRKAVGVNDFEGIRRVEGQDENGKPILGPEIDEKTKRNKMDDAVRAILAELPELEAAERNVVRNMMLRRFDARKRNG